MSLTWAHLLASNHHLFVSVTFLRVSISGCPSISASKKALTLGLSPFQHTVESALLIPGGLVRRTQELLHQLRDACVDTILRAQLGVRLVSDQRVWASCFKRKSDTVDGKRSARTQRNITHTSSIKKAKIHCMTDSVLVPLS